jgi:hypothetical protein
LKKKKKKRRRRKEKVKMVKWQQFESLDEGGVKSHFLNI